MAVPVKGTYPAYFERYVGLVAAASLQEAVALYSPIITAYFKKLPEVLSVHSYAPGKWTIAEMLQHIIDTERIFAYRILCIARKDTTPLPGFDENEYAANSFASRRSWPDLLNEFEAVRHATNLLLLSLGEEQINYQGITNNQPATANAIGFVAFGHILHHINILNERYL